MHFVLHHDLDLTLDDLPCTPTDAIYAHVGASDSIDSAKAGSMVQQGLIFVDQQLKACSDLLVRDPFAALDMPP